MMLSIARKLWGSTSKVVLLGIIAYHCIAFTPPSNTSSAHLVRRFLSQSPSQQSSTNLGANGGSTYDPCGWMNLTAQTWQDLGIDEYIANYPNANQLTIQQFAAELNVPNFFCGIGSDCSAGQICSPASGVNWIILYAIQQWNVYTNSFYRAIEDAISAMRDASADIISDFTPRVKPTSGLYGWSVASVVAGILGTFTALLVPAVMPANAMQMVVDAAAIGSGAGLLGIIEVPSAEHTLKVDDFLDEIAKARAEADNSILKPNSEDQKAARNLFNGGFKPSTPPPLPHVTEGTPSGNHQLRKRALPVDERPKTRHPTPTSFTRWSHIATHLTVLQNELQGYMSATVSVATLQPLLAEGGIAAQLRGGTYLYENPTQFYLDKSYKAVAQITALAEFFRSLKMFVTIGSDDCKYGGPNGAKNNPQDLSYCDEKGMMMNIVRAGDDNKVVNKMENAGLLKSKYGYNVKDLATMAWNCQKKYGVQKPDEPNYPPPVTLESDCLFYIPVCDCTLPKVAHLRKKHKSTVVACRNGAGLPI